MDRTPAIHMKMSRTIKRRIRIRPKPVPTTSVAISNQSKRPWTQAGTKMLSRIKKNFPLWLNLASDRK